MTCIVTPGSSATAQVLYLKPRRRLEEMRAHELATIAKKPLHRLYAVARSNGLNISGPNDEISTTGSLRIISAFTGLRLLENTREVRISDLARVSGSTVSEIEAELQSQNSQSAFKGGSEVSFEQALRLLAIKNKEGNQRSTRNKPIRVEPPRPRMPIGATLPKRHTLQRSPDNSLLSIDALATELCISSDRALEAAISLGIPVTNKRSLLSREQSLLISKFINNDNIKTFERTASPQEAPPSLFNDTPININYQAQKEEERAKEAVGPPLSPNRSKGQVDILIQDKVAHPSQLANLTDDPKNIGILQDPTRKGSLSGQEVFLLPHSTIGILGEFIGGGGEGEVYCLENHAPLAIKIFSEGDTRDLKLSKLEAQLHIQDRVRSECVHWPKALVCNSTGQPIGYVMKRVSDGIPLSKLGHSMLWREIFPKVDRGQIATMLSRLAMVVEDLHRNDIIIGDVNMHNILISDDLQKIHIVDTDSMQVRDENVVYRCTVGSPGLTPNELQLKRFDETDRTIESDIFGLAIVMFQALMLGRHPYDAVGGTSQIENIRRGYFPYAKRGVRPGTDGAIPPGPSNLWFNLWSHLTFNLKTLFIECFDEDKGAFTPSKRPQLSMWREALDSFAYEVSVGRSNGEMLPTNSKQSKQFHIADK